jgi:hypothetical protein
MRPCLHRDWNMAASSGEEKTRTGSRGETERKALRIEGGDIVGIGGWGQLEGVSGAKD